MSIASLLYRRSLINDRYNAEMGLLRGSAAMRGALHNPNLMNADLAMVSKMELANQLQMDQFQTELQVIRAEEAALKNYEASKTGNTLNLVG